MTSVVDRFRALLPPRTKTSPSGWLSFNAPCCHHRGHKPDTRKRAGVRFDTGIVYNCFNCKFSTGWQPGNPLGEKMKSLCRWLGASEHDIRSLVFEAMKTEALDYEPKIETLTIQFENKSLPENTMSLKEWAEVMQGEIDEQLGDNFAAVIRYLIDRGYENPFDYDFYWSANPGFMNRAIIPFRWQDQIVGYTARKITDGKPKYISDQHPNFVFNFDQQMPQQRYILVTEGPFDALAVNGVALLGNEISDLQSRVISSLGAEVVVIPDQDRAGLNLFGRALELGWSVASPNWETDVKDSAEAVKRYGRLFVIVDAIMTAAAGSIKISMAKKQLEYKLERLSQNDG
jgi:hypothetical protein